MGCFLPNLYKKSVFDIPYSVLQQKGITCLIFDLDNTLAKIDEECSLELVQFLDQLQNDFSIGIITNNTQNRVKTYQEKLNVPIFAMALKPSVKKLKKVQKIFGVKKQEMCMIGDQLVTDILMAHRFKIFSCLVDPLTEKDLKITSINRFMERKIFRRYQKKGWLERGKYDE